MPHRKLARLLFVLIVAVTAVADTRLSGETRDTIKSVVVRVSVMQDDIMIPFQAIGAPSASMSNLARSGTHYLMLGGVLGAAADIGLGKSHLQETMSEAALLYPTIEDIRVRQLFLDAIQSKLSVYPFKIDKVVATAAPLPEDARDKLLRALRPDQGLLAIEPSYFLTKDCRSLVVETTVALWDQSGIRWTKPLYLAVLHYQSQPTAQSGKAAIEAWAANDGVRFRAALDEGIAETVKMATTDFDLPDDYLKHDFRTLLQMNSGVDPIDLEGRLISETPDRTVMLATGGAMVSLPKRLPPPAK